MEIDDIKIKLKKEIKEHSIIPFIGSGFSAHVAPTWNQFIKDLFAGISECTLSEEQKKTLFQDPLEAAEFFIWQKVDELIEKGKIPLQDPNNIIHYEAGKDILLKFIKSQLIFNVKENKDKQKIVEKDGKDIVLDTHQALCDKFKRVIYTTNWDNLIEKVGGFDDVNIRTQLQHKKTRERDGIVIKFHGKPDGDGYARHWDDGLIVSKTDYWKRITEENPFDILFKNDLIQYNFIFIGYSFRDPNISLMIYEWMKILKPMGPQNKILWAVIDYRNDPRIFCLQKHTGIEPIYLLTERQCKDLRILEDQIKTYCLKCKICDITMDISVKDYCKKTCANMIDCQDKLNKKREEYIKQGIKNLIDQF